MRNRSWKLKFLIGACVLMAAAVVYETQLSNPPAMIAAPGEANLVEPAAVVVVVQSEKADAFEITEAEIKALVRQAIEMAGGFDGVIEDGDTVILKPNLITYYALSTIEEDLDPDANGLTTDWRVTKAVSELVREANPSGQIIVLEGVAVGRTCDTMQQLNYTSEAMPEVADFICLEERSGEYREYDAPELVAVTLEDVPARYSDYLKPNGSPEFYLNRVYYEADVLISLPVLKNHSISSVTGAVKNVGIGATPQNIYTNGPTINERWRGNVISHTPYNLHRWIHDYYACRPVDFAIMDGLQGSFNGPVATGSLYLSRAQTNMRLILASRDSVALDAVASVIMQYDPGRIDHLVHLHNSGLGCVDTALLRVVGVEPTLVSERFVNVHGAERHISDLDAPELSIESCTIVEDAMDLLVAVGEDTKKLEIGIDGVDLGSNVIGGFDDTMRLTVPALEAGEHTVTVRAYDEYLNVSTEQVQVTTGP